MLRKFKPKSEFGLNFLTLLKGSGLSQIIIMGASPILTRIYSPEYFGVSALFLSISSVLMILGTGRYEMAIIQARRNVDALSLGISTIAISFCFFILTVLGLVIFSNYTRLIDLNQKLAGLIFLIPVYVIIVSIYKVMNNYFNRNKYYEIITVNQIGQSIFQSSGKLYFGYINLSINGLVIGTILGQAIALILIIYRFANINLEKSSYKLAITRIKSNLKRYINFPKFMLVSDGINVIALQTPFLLTSYFFSMEQLGYLSLAYSMSSRPLSFIADSLSRVFRQQAADDYNKTGRCDKLFLNIFKKLSILTLLPFTIIIFTAPYLFKMIFGDEWYESGQIVQIIIIMFYFQFLARILGYMYILTEHQKENLYLQLILFIGSITSFGIGYFLFNNLFISLILYTLMYSVIYIYTIYKSYVYSKGDLYVNI